MLQTVDRLENLLMMDQEIGLHQQLLVIMIITEMIMELEQQPDLDTLEI